MRIQHNIDAMRGLRYGQKLNTSMTKSLQKLSSGYRINSAADDAAGLAVSEKMRLFMTEYDRCTDNVKEGENLAQTADAALQEVNDMLCRAKELCVRAANGTYSAQEREALQDELEALYSEMDRIFESSRFNTVQLFRYGGTPSVPGHFELVEHAEPTEDLQTWGEMPELEDKYFDLAKPAEGATVTFKLDSTVDPNDISTVIGKSICVVDSNCIFKFVDAPGNSTVSRYGSTNDTGHAICNIGVRDCATLQDALDKMCEYMKTNSTSAWSNTVGGEKMYLKEAVVEGDEVTLTFNPVDLVQSIPLGDGTEEYFIAEADGEKTNGLSVASKEQFDLEQVDGADATNNTIAYTKAEVTLTFLPGKADNYVLTDADKQTISTNSIRTYSGSEIKFSLDGSNASAIDLRGITTAGDLRSALASKLNDESYYDAVKNGDGSVTVTQSAPRNYDYIVENVEKVPSTSQSQATTALPLTVQHTVTPSGETKDAYTVTLPNTLPDYFSVKIGSSTYSFYNGVPSGFDYATGSAVNIAGKSVQDVHNTISNYIASAYPNANVSISGNTVSVQGKYYGDDLKVGENVKGTTGTIYFYKNSTTTGTPILTGSSSTKNFSQDMTLSLDLSVAMDGGAFDASKLVGRGFKLGTQWYEFDDGDAATPQRRTDSKAVDVSACTSYDDVRDALDAAMSQLNLSAAHDVAVTNTTATPHILTISAERTTSSSSGTAFVDGYVGIDGLFSEEPVDGPTTKSLTADGGTLAGQPFATIDFSKYDSSNFKELYGTGFRVTCATCSGEYINVMFCNDKDTLDIPESFEVMDESQTPPVARVIHNLAVELKGMSSGEDIVKAIVEQLRPELDHYTDVEVGRPATVLNVLDKRRGDIEVGGKVYRAQVLSGVHTNFVYTFKEEFIPDPTDGVAIDFRTVGIYAGSEPEPQIIDVHLPFLTLRNLGLTDPDPNLSTTEAAAETMGHVIEANNAIAYVRGTIGADFNRLEHAHANLSQSEVQMTDAYSRIRDADMAEEMMEKVRVSILQQAQQTTFMHSMQQPQQIISLLGA